MDEMLESKIRKQVKNTKECGRISDTMAYFFLTRLKSLILLWRQAETSSVLLFMLLSFVERISNFSSMQRLHCPESLLFVLERLSMLQLIE